MVPVSVIVSAIALASCAKAELRGIVNRTVEKASLPSIE